jgi:hypothetical protein
MLTACLQEGVRRNRYSAFGFKDSLEASNKGWLYLGAIYWLCILTYTYNMA